MRLDQGIWYRRHNGGMYAARYVGPVCPTGLGTVEVMPLHPNTLEPDGSPRVLYEESFHCFYCRRAELAS